MRRALAPLALLVVLTACGGGGGPSSTSPPAPNTVQVANFAFSPSTITVARGTTVTWAINQPDSPHNVVSLDGPASFNSGVPVGKGTFHFTFTQPGTYTYDCQVHPSMRGTVIVTP